MYSVQSKSFLEVFLSDLVPLPIKKSGTVIIKTDPHTESGSHLLAIYFQPKSSNAFYFDYYDLSHLLPISKHF